nr:hypothetical protein [Erythrobacter mangrovi]
MSIEGDFEASAFDIRQAVDDIAAVEVRPHGEATSGETVITIRGAEIEDLLAGNREPLSQRAGEEISQPRAECIDQLSRPLPVRQFEAAGLPVSGWSDMRNHRLQTGIPHRRLYRPVGDEAARVFLDESHLIRVEADLRPVLAKPIGIPRSVADLLCFQPCQAALHVLVALGRKPQDAGRVEDRRALAIRQCFPVTQRFKRHRRIERIAAIAQANDPAFAAGRTPDIPRAIGVIEGNLQATLPKMPSSPGAKDACADYGHVQSL